MQTNHVLGFTEQGFHKVVYHEWGDSNNPNVLFCVHGLTRNSRDFDFLAERLKSHYRIICPDIVGRGQSDWLTVRSHYEPMQYIRDMVILLARVNAKTVTWLGTSMGGLIGIILAAFPQTPIQRLILNDIGPFVSTTSMQNLGAALSSEQEFPDLLALLVHLKQIYQSLGPLDESIWQHILKYDHRKNPNGSYSRNFDPAIATQVSQAQRDAINLWPYWANIHQPTLVIHGELSEILTPDIVQTMQQNKPHLILKELPGIGHTPSLMIESEINLVCDFLGVKTAVRV